MLWAALLPVLAFVLPTVAAVGLAMQFTRAVRRQRLLPREPVRALSELGAAAAAIGLVVYGIGNWQGHLVDPRSANEICGSQVARALEQSALPLHNRCWLVDGRAFDLVPGWINPSLALALVVVLVCAVLAVLAVRARTRLGNSTSATVRGRQP